MPGPDEIFETWSGVEHDDFQLTMRKAFDLPDDDEYIYRAEAFAMTLAQVQEQLDTGTLKYVYQAKHAAIPIPPADIDAYTSIFAASTDTSKALASFLSNAKKESPRRNVATYLSSQRLLPESLKPPRSKKHTNPYLDVWAYSCRSTGFVGPLQSAEYADVASARMTHPMLPVLYHHFGCACPSWEAVAIVKQLAAAGGAVDMASGNGYWTYILRRAGVDVVAVDNLQSAWRYTWIPDTVQTGGVEWLRRNGGAAGRVLLLVYMVTHGSFTRDVLRAYAGATVVVVGTQNANRYTGFADMGVDEYFERHMAGWTLTVRVALPSFAGKDDALYVFQKGA